MQAPPDARRARPFVRPRLVAAILAASALACSATDADDAASNHAGGSSSGTGGAAAQPASGGSGAAGEPGGSGGSAGATGGSGGTSTAGSAGAGTAGAAGSAEGGHAGAGAAGSAGASGGNAGASGSGSDTEYAPYFYTWGWGNSAYAFTDLVDMKAKSGLDAVTLAFVLADAGQCKVTREIHDHLADVQAFEGSGGHVKVSFGGALGTYLENACSSADAMADALRAFVDETGLTDLDFDVEQPGAMTADVNQRRAQALRAVQLDRGIRVSFTLAAMPEDKWGTPGGVTAAGLDVLSAAVQAQVDILHVNLMTMDYGGYFSDGQLMGALAISVLAETHEQLMALIPGLSEDEGWRMLGATPMIGQNDVASEVFTLDDAQALVDFARQKRIGLVSFWAIQRDQPCPYEDLGVCSKVNTSAFQLHDVFETVK